VCFASRRLSGRSNAVVLRPGRTRRGLIGSPHNHRCSHSFSLSAITCVLAATVALRACAAAGTVSPRDAANVAPEFTALLGKILPARADYQSHAASSIPTRHRPLWLVEINHRPKTSRRTIPHSIYGLARIVFGGMNAPLSPDPTGGVAHTQPLIGSDSPNCRSAGNRADLLSIPQPFPWIDASWSFF
jgi:hypothetical protein